MPFGASRSLGPKGRHQRTLQWDAQTTSLWPFHLGTWRLSARPPMLADQKLVPQFWISCALDVSKIHGQRPDLGLRVFTHAAPDTHAARKIAL